MRGGMKTLVEDDELKRLRAMADGSKPFEESASQANQPGSRTGSAFWDRVAGAIEDMRRQRKWHTRIVVTTIERNTKALSTFETASPNDVLMKAGVLNEKQLDGMLERVAESGATAAPSKSRPPRLRPSRRR